MHKSRLFLDESRRAGTAGSTQLPNMRNKATEPEKAIETCAFSIRIFRCLISQTSRRYCGAPTQWPQPGPAIAHLGEASKDVDAVALHPVRR